MLHRQWHHDGGKPQSHAENLYKLGQIKLALCTPAWYIDS